MQNRKLGNRKLMKKHEIQSGGVSTGAEGLTSLLGNYTRNKDIKTSIRVGLVGKNFFIDLKHQKNSIEKNFHSIFV